MLRIDGFGLIFIPALRQFQKNIKFLTSLKKYTLHYGEFLEVYLMWWFRIETFIQKVRTLEQTNNGLNN